MDKSTKVLVLGCICATLVLIGGFANSYRLESKLTQLEAACEEQDKEREQNPPGLILICKSEELHGLDSLQGIQGEIVKAQRSVSRANKWPYLVAAGLLLLSALPWLWYFFIRRIRELREAITGK